VIHAQRRVHRAAFAALALLLPALLASAWRVRRPPPLEALAPELLPGVRAVPGSEAALGDVLVYWSAAAPRPGDPLPADAELAGALRSLAGAAPPAERPHVVLYDLAHGAVVAAPPVEAR
jgi:hypothetical protein